ncbi:MAG: hypothetical protein LBM07_01375 [Culturomica sp.]|jgi:tetratricopeptide (TPR) repeat protein|nr:hypothetical protein [Culturomica sp.]
MLSIGKKITQKDDPLTGIEPQQLSEMIQQPDEVTLNQIARLRLIRTIDKKQYGVMKRELPYVVCGIFNPPYRRIENFGSIEYFIVDIDHIAEKGLSMDSLRSRLIADSRVMLCFVSPSEDGLKLLFHLSEKCYDAGKYSLFYKVFIQVLATQYGFAQAVDKATSDVSRACFLSHDPQAFFNPDAETVRMSDFVDFSNPFMVGELQRELDKEAKEEKINAPVEKSTRQISDDAIAFIKERLQAKTRLPRQKPQVYVPEELNQILEKLLQYIGESGISTESVENISYGKKFKFRAGLAQAEINLFFGKRGFSVVKSPRQGTSEQLNNLMAEYIGNFIEDYVLINNKQFHIPEGNSITETEMLRQQANTFHSEKNFAEALPLYRSLWEGFREDCNEWDGWRYAFCLKQLKRYKDALNVCREVYKINHTFEPNNGLYAWCIYYTEISPEPIKDEIIFYRAANAVTNLTRQDDKYSAYTVTVFKILNYLIGKASYQTDKILEWTEKLNPELLDTETFSFTDRNGEQRELASKKEQYYAWRSKALLEKGRWDECMELCNKALETVSPLHYDNDVWFRWRIGLCYEGKGLYAEALAQQLELLRRKKEWFIQREIAEQLHRQGKHKEALQYALDAALNSGDLDKKAGLFNTMADILKALGMNEEAQTQRELAGALHEHAEHPPIQEAKRLWSRLKFADRQLLSGVIKTILPNGKAGFIETASHKSYYFRLKDCKGKAAVGQKVKFYLEKGFDAKKNKETENAVEVSRV